MIGLSLTGCVRDLAEERISPTVVDKVITSTRYDTTAKWVRAIHDNIVPAGAWRRNPPEHVYWLWWLLLNDMIEQPRLQNNDHFPDLANGQIWVESEDEIVWVDAE